MKKIMIMLAALLLLMTAGCNTNKGKIIECRPSQIRQMFDDDRDFFLVVGVSTCSTCQNVKYLLEVVVRDHPVTVYYLSADYDKEQDIMDDLIYNYLYRLDYTPSVYAVTKGEVTDFDQDGESLTRYDYMCSFLIRNGFWE